ncbi:hypothetical protein [Halorubrum sp. DTA46]|uniref:hypothetical protein n=1 Tax=Halorubrum sp. DTA46 TaxID=3402162 RepID=UPI003AADD5FF
MPHPYAEHGQYWKTRPYGIGQQPHFRLEDLPPDIANNPSGRGPDTAAGRGYDVEHVLEYVIDGARISRYRSRDAVVRDDDSRWGSDEHTVDIEAKSCINWYPSGSAGTFRIWERNHWVLSTTPEAYYFLLVYRVDASGAAIEIGKIMTPIERIDAIIDEGWTTYDSSQRSGRQYIDLPWPRVLSALDVSIELLREWELVYA